VGQTVIMRTEDKERKARSYQELMQEIQNKGGIRDLIRETQRGLPYGWGEDAYLFELDC
jgi:hypothetical protein